MRKGWSHCRVLTRHSRVATPYAGAPNTRRHRDRFRDRLGGTYEAMKAS